MPLANLKVRTGAAIRRATVCPGESPSQYGGGQMTITISGIEALCKSGLLVEVDPNTLPTKLACETGPSMQHRG